MAGRKSGWLDDATPIDEIAKDGEMFLDEETFRELRNYEDPAGENPGIVRNKMMSAIVSRCKYLDAERGFFIGDWRFSDGWEMKSIGYRTLKDEEREPNQMARHEFKFEQPTRRGFHIWRLR